MRNFAILLLIALSPSLHADEPSPPVFREVWLDGKEPPAMLGQGSWSIVPYSEFTYLRQQAEEYAKLEKQPPWLTSIHLETEIRGQQLIGTAHLVMRNPHRENSWGTIAPWSLSIRPTSNGAKSATLRNGPQPRSLQLLVDRQSNQLMELPIQVEGEQRQDGLWFTLQLPASPQASLDVLVQEGLRIEWPRARQFLSGPYATSNQLQRYSFSLDGQTPQELQFVVRKPGATASNSNLEARLDAEYQVKTQVIEAKYEIAVQRWQDRLRQLELEVPDSLVVSQFQLKQGDSLVSLKPTQARPSRLLITFPEEIEQRATLVLYGRIALQPGSNISFHTPHIVNCNSRHTLRINSAAEKLEHWQWGDYSPQERTTPATANAGFSMTLVSSGFRTNSPWRPPSARLAPRQADRSQKQHTYLTIGKKCLLKVQCQLSSPSAPAIYRWNVPSGWKVDEVSAGENQSNPLWHWLPGQPLEVELEPGQRSEPGIQITVKLTPAQTWQYVTEPITLPHLQPISNDPWSGVYSLHLDRQGSLLPDSLTVLQSPGPATPSAETIMTVPECNWLIHNLHATAMQPGKIRIDSWPEVVQADLLTELTEKQIGWVIRYRLKLHPQAGKISQYPLRFSAPAPHLMWRNVYTNAEVAWKLEDSLHGKLLFPEPLSQPIELECLLPWAEQQDIPLMFHPDARSAFKLPAQWLPQASPSNGLHATDTPGIWHYDQNVQQVQLRRVRTTSLQLISPQLISTLNDNFVICEYSTTIPDHIDPLNLKLPAEALLIASTSGDVSSGTMVTIPPSNIPLQFQLSYRLPIESKWGLTSWKPRIPVWNIPSDPEVLKITIQPSNMLPFPPLSVASSTMFWIPVQILAPVIAGILLLCFWLCRRTQWRMILAVVLSICSLSLFPGQLTPISVIVLTFLVTMLLKSRPARRMSVAFLIVASNTVWAIAQPAPSPVLAFIIAGKTNQQADALVMLPSNALAQLKNNVSQKQQEHTSGCWVKEVVVKGDYRQRSWELTSHFTVQNQNSLPFDMPWMQAVLPSEVLVDGQPGKLKAGNLAFGLVQQTITIPPGGVHRVTARWILPAAQESSWETALLRWPGCPAQAFELEGMSSAYLKTESGSLSLHPGTVTTCGGCLQSKLFSPATPTNLVRDTHADVAVHWDHRPAQSIMNVLVSYDLKSNLTDTLSLDLPRTVQLRSMNLAGEKQALASPRIRQWRLTPELASQRITIELQRPVSGQFYLLLELPYERSMNNVIPLTGIDLVDVPLRHCFVAYSTDGLLARLQDNAKVISRSSAQFATAWMPTLSSLPDHAFLKMQPLASIAPAVELSTVPLIPDVSTRSTLTLDDRQVERRIDISVIHPSLPVTMLQGYLPPESQLISVTGDEVVAWQQSTPLEDKRTEILIWFQPRTRQGTRMACSLLTRNTLTSGTSSLALQPISWNAQQASAETVSIYANTFPISWKLSDQVKEHCGPWQVSSQLARFSLPLNNQKPENLSWDMSKPGAPPVLTVLPETLSKRDQRQINIVAATGSTLPDELHILSREPKLQHIWQWHSSSAHTSYASKTPEGILWTIRFSKPVARLEGTCFSPPGSTLPVIEYVSVPATSRVRR